MLGAPALALASAAGPAMAQVSTSPDRDGDKAKAATGDSDVVVTGTIYRGEVASGGARIDVAIEDLPLSISVVTEALIKDRQVRNLRELSENVAGVQSRVSGSGAFSVDFTIRGLQGGNGDVVAVNGFRVGNFSNGFEPAGVERVEFLKGPASVLYGASGQLSGLVNIVTKVPRADDFLIVDVTGGAPSYARSTVDGNVRLTDTLESRTNLAVTLDSRRNAFRDITAQFAAQSLRWHPADVSIVAEGQYFHSVAPSRESTQYPELERFFELPDDFKLGERWDRSVITNYLARLDASWSVTPQLTLRQGMNYQYGRETGASTSFYTFDTFDTLIGPDTTGRSARLGNGDSSYFVSQTEVRWKIDLGPTRHLLLAGFEYASSRSGGFCCDYIELPPLDLDHPVYGAPEPKVALTDLYENRNRNRAFYVQDFVELGQLKLLAGLRRDAVRSSSASCSTLTPGCSEGDPVVRNLGDARETALSPRLGLAWQPSRGTTLFASWSRSFNPNTGLDRDNRLLPSERGEQYEAGIRQDLLAPGRLTLSASVYDLTRQNIADCDPLYPDCARQIAIGQQKVRGAEVELAGKPLSWVDLIATYSYIDGKVTRSDEETSGIAVGSKLPEATPHAASLFAKLALAPLGLPDVALSTGVYYVSRRPGRDFFYPYVSPFSPSVRELPGSTRLDLGAYWQVSPVMRVQGNITNVFDVSVYEPVNVGFNRTQPRRATAGVGFSL